AATIRAATAASCSATSAGASGEAVAGADGSGDRRRLRRALRRRLAGRLARSALAGRALASGRLARAAGLLRRAVLLRRHFAAGLPRLRQADRDRLLLALHRLAGAAALQRAALALVHRLLDLFRRLVAIRCHRDVLVSG